METKELETRIATELGEANAFDVRDKESDSVACSRLLAVKALRKAVAETFDPIIEKAHQAHGEALAQKRRHDEPLRNVETIYKVKIGNYREAEQKARLAEEARLMAEEKRRAEDDLLRKAEEAERSGDREGAEQVLAAPVQAAPVVLQRQVADTRQVTAPRVWKFRVANAAAVPREFLVPDEAKIGAYVRTMKEQARIPGVEVYSELSVRGRA